MYVFIYIYIYTIYNIYIYMCVCSSELYQDLPRIGLTRAFFFLAEFIHRKNPVKAV